ncbi:hypothetical protein [Halobaculum lipolyticum]|uniref:Uncharacterized protein n=1 Tax=Halobaculum lipolyticum TaxID=3032001 RepID=A0ABD5WEL5_9EURY|nr:hypothetical protein [Halobaculum sp. DT31]
MGGEPAAREPASDANRGDDRTERSLDALRDENERLRERLAERKHEQRRIVDRYETLLDAARTDAEREATAEGDTPAGTATDRSTVERLLDRIVR